jgi:hypothetical protein
MESPFSVRLLAIQLSAMKENCPDDAPKWKIRASPCVRFRGAGVTGVLNDYIKFVAYITAACGKSAANIFKFK